MVIPVILPGCDGTVITVALTVLGVPEPHVLLAVTDIVPPLEPTVVDIVLVVEFPLHPDGNVQVYDVAPVIDGTL